MPIIELYCELADSCLLYLTSCPATLTHEDVAAAYLLTDGVHLNFGPLDQGATISTTASTQFFMLTAIICAQYAQVNASTFLL